MLRRASAAASQFEINVAPEWNYLDRSSAHNDANAV
jgi:hypothetical protein